jgi:hypothetical protein
MSSEAHAPLDSDKQLRAQNAGHRPLCDLSVVTITGRAPDESRAPDETTQIAAVTQNLTEMRTLITALTIECGPFDEGSTTIPVSLQGKLKVVP